MTTFQNLTLLVFCVFISTVLLSQKNELNANSDLDKLAIALSQKYSKATVSIFAFNKNARYQKVFQSGNALDRHDYNYEIGSISKTFNSLLILNNVKILEVFLKEEVGQYFPQFSSDVQKIKMLELLNHSSGLPSNFSALPIGSDPTQKLVDTKVEKWFQKKKIPTKKKGKYVYSNVGYALLGMVLEQKFGEDWPSLIEQRILSNGMKNSYVHSENKPDEKKLRGMNKKGKEVATWQFNTYDAAGAIISNIEDMKLYLDMAREHHETYAEQSHWISAGGKSNTGLSWITDNLSDEIKYYWHNGQTNGFSSYMGWIEKMDLGVIVLVNQAVDIDVFSGTLLNAVIAHDNSTVIE